MRPSNQDPEKMGCVFGPGNPHHDNKALKVFISYIFVNFTENAVKNVTYKHVKMSKHLKGVVFKGV